ncbi:MAG: enoyl-CoA hydratase-related protein [Sphingopyxis sp.]
MITPPHLEQFRVEVHEQGILHLVFDAPARSMNVFSNAAIHELAVFARWLRDADCRGVIVRSGKESGFCAGADLTELGVAYDDIMQSPPYARFNVAFDHFFALSAALRALETAGKPIACAIAGVALGGGCELALAAHYRVLADDPRAAMGLPESLVGLLPGAGGTQRLPRLVGLAAAMPILLDGARLAGTAALQAGLVDAVVPAGDEVRAAQAWLMSAPQPCQPWDRPGWTAPDLSQLATSMAGLRAQTMAQTRGLYPAPIAILDCVEYGLPQCFDGAIRSEMAIFSHLIQRPEPRNMIQTLFLGKVDHDRAARAGTLPAAIADALAAARGVAGDFADPATVDAVDAAVAPWRAALSATDARMADYAIVSALGYPAYLGGPFTRGVRRRDVAGADVAR